MSLRTLIITIALLTSLMLSGRTQVSLLTCGPGGEIYELEGHTALRINHPHYGDFTVNWGVFDFNSPGFVYRFVKGETDYIAAAAPTELFLEAYRRQGRTVYEQVLNLDSIQAERLTQMALWNIRPENRVYRYNYVLDNCATRPLVMIEKAVGDTILENHVIYTMPESAGDMPTFRKEMRRYHKNYPWYQFGIDLALGSGIDRPITWRELAFAPVALVEMVRGAHVSIDDASDDTCPFEPVVVYGRYLVGDEDTPAVTAGPTPWWLTPMFWACVTMLLAIWVSVRQWSGHVRGAKWFDTIYFSICGLCGLLLTFLIFVSVHEATSPNWLYLWLNPLCFIGAVAPWLKRGKCLEICYQSVNFALLILLVCVFLLGIQSPNEAFWPLMAATAVRCITIIKIYRRGRGDGSDTAGQ